MATLLSDRLALDIPRLALLFLRAFGCFSRAARGSSLSVAGARFAVAVCLATGTMLHCRDHRAITGITATFISVSVIPGNCWFDWGFKSGPGSVCDDVIRENPASPGTETLAEVLVGPPVAIEEHLLTHGFTHTAPHRTTHPTHLAAVLPPGSSRAQASRPLPPCRVLAAQASSSHAPSP